MNQTTPAHIRVLIVDDIPQVRQGLSTTLKLAAKNSHLEIEIVGEAQDGNDAIRQAELLQPDVVVMDLEMPELNGFLATQAIKSSHPSTYIIILTIHGDPDTRQEAFSVGADAFIEKIDPIEGLIRAIHNHGQAHYDKEHA